MNLHILRDSKEHGSLRLHEELVSHIDAGKNVLWLVSGGSNVDLECAIAEQLGDVSNVTAALIDERYGEPDHGDSNFQKLQASGFTDKLELLPVLIPGMDIAATTEDYAKKLEQHLDQADVVIAQLGIGADGHTAGVLPGSPVVGSKKLVEHYQGPDFQRITMTLEALRFADIAFVFCYGSDKHQALTRLAQENVPLIEQPSQILKLLPEVYLYNDQVEGGHS